jgi:hypothetical protein
MEKVVPFFKSFAIILYLKNLEFRKDTVGSNQFKSFRNILNKLRRVLFSVGPAHFPSPPCRPTFSWHNPHATVPNLGTPPLSRVAAPPGRDPAPPLARPAATRTPLLHAVSQAGPPSFVPFPTPPPSRLEIHRRCLVARFHHTPPPGSRARKSPLPTPITTRPLRASEHRCHHRNGSKLHHHFSPSR